MLVFLNSDLLKYWLVESTLWVNTGYIQCYFLTLIRDYAVWNTILEQHGMTAEIDSTRIDRSRVLTLGWHCI